MKVSSVRNTESEESPKQKKKKRQTQWLVKIQIRCLVIY